MGANVKTEWFGDEYTAKLNTHVEGNMDAAAIHLEWSMRTEVTQASSRKGATPSAPGQPPHVDTGHLSRAISWDKPRPLARRIGTGIGKSSGEGGSQGYAVWLEFGTSKMAARPWLRPPLYAERKNIERLVAVPMK